MDALCGCPASWRRSSPVVVGFFSERGQRIVSFWGLRVFLARKNFCRINGHSIFIDSRRVKRVHYLFYSRGVQSFMAIAANPSSMPLAELRRMMEAAGGTGSHRPVLPFGIKEIDEALPGGGLALGAVHELSEEGPRGGYAACALLFAAGILARLRGPILWCLHSRDLFAPALARVGLHPDRIIFCETWKDSEILPAMEEGLRMRGLAGVVGELNRISLTPSRRLQLAAETSGVPALIIRRSSEHLNRCSAMRLCIAVARHARADGPCGIGSFPLTAPAKYASGSSRHCSRFARRA